MFYPPSWRESSSAMRPQFFIHSHFFPLWIFCRLVDTKFTYLCCKIECPAACFCDPKLVYVIRQQNLFSPFQILMHYFHHSRMSWKRTQPCCCLSKFLNVAPCFHQGLIIAWKIIISPMYILQCIQCSNSFNRVLAKQIVTFKKKELVAYPVLKYLFPLTEEMKWNWYIFHI